MLSYLWYIDVFLPQLKPSSQQLGSRTTQIGVERCLSMWLLEENALEGLGRLPSNVGVHDVNVMGRSSSPLGLLMIMKLLFIAKLRPYHSKDN